MRVTVATPQSTSTTRLVHAPDSPLGDIARLCARIAASDATVLLTGETGTGKEVFARLIHEQSPRADQALVPVNCAAIPETLLESELFGYVRGAFTGAVQSRRGRLALAEKGTLFLDEIGELSLPLQAKLLRVLQERCYEPVGSTEPVPADFRLVAATNRDLAEEVEAGRFRQDLYYRLHVCPIELPPLRERPSDVAPLFLHFWKRRGEKREIAPAALAALAGYDWPGNVRELENLVERISICSESEVIGLEDLPLEIQRAPIVLDAFRLERTSWSPKEAPGGYEGPALVRAPEEEAREGGREADRATSDGGEKPAPVGISAGSTQASAEGRRSPATPTGSEAAATAEDLGDLATAGSAPATGAHDPDPAAAPDRPLDDPVELVAATPSFPLDLPALLKRIEVRFIEAALERSEGNRKAAAELLGLQRTTLVEKLKRHNREAQRQS